MSHAAEHQKAGPTYDDIERLPPGVNGEILAGELVASPRPAGPHAMAASRLQSLVGPPFDLGLGGPGGWVILFEPELSLGVDPAYDPVIPDLAGWRVEAMPERVMTAQFNTVPAWVCEVVSPSTQRHDRVLKLPFYARAGVAHAWLVDPIAETLEVFALEGGRWVVAGSYSADDVVRAAPFDAVDVPLSWLWGRKPPKTEG